jgi:hypothetical protein
VYSSCNIVIVIKSRRTKRTCCTHARDQNSSLFVGIASREEEAAEDTKL